MSTIPTIRLNDGNAMPQLGYGVWRVTNEEAASTVGEAIKAGYRSIDTAVDLRQRGGRRRSHCGSPRVP